jgi:UDP-N-acetylmuramoylalanine--D-glutamate ligase
VKAFEVSPHRLEVVAKKNNIKFIDDSKSTNIHSTLHAMSRMEESSKVVLLLGGQNKNLKFDDIFEQYQNKLDLVVAFGAARNDVYRAAKRHQFENIKVVRTFAEGVGLACQGAKENNIVLLSPGCASFDEFSGYEERGKAFSKIVREYIDVKS